MRYLFGFLCVCALGVVPLVGCSEAAKCTNAEDCDDQNECTDDACKGGFCDYVPNDARCDFDGLDDFFNGLDGVCVNGACEANPCDDDNECTHDFPFEDACEHIGCTGCQPCDWNGSPGVCVDGVCEAYPCNDGDLCDDGDLCTYNFCDYKDEMCHFNPRCRSGQCTIASCDPADGSCSYTNRPDGTACSCTGVICICPGTYICSGGVCVCRL